MGCRKTLPRTMPCSRLSPTTMPSMARRKSSRFRVVGASAATFATAGCASSTRDAGAGWVESQLGMPFSLVSLTRFRVERKRGTPEGSHPAAAAYSTPRRSDSISSSREYFRKSTPRPMDDRS
jgi:hypothetical protein